MASVPPASTRLERPATMFTYAESSACMPEAQLRITVHAGTFSPQPRRSDTTRPMLASSAEGIAAPTITSSNALRLERLAHEQRAPGAHREVRGGERPEPGLRLEERRARAVDYMDAAATFFFVSACHGSSRCAVRDRSWSKSSTLITSRFNRSV